MIKMNYVSYICYDVQSQNIVLKITDLKILMVQQNSSIHFKVPKIYDFDQIR